MQINPFSPNWASNLVTKSKGECPMKMRLHAILLAACIALPALNAHAADTITVYKQST